MTGSVQAIHDGERIPVLRAIGEQAKELNGIERSNAGTAPMRPVPPGRQRTQAMKREHHLTRTRSEHSLDLVCDGCGSTSSDVRLVEVEDPDGQITTCDACEPQLRSTIVREIDSNDLTKNS